MQAPKARWQMPRVTVLPGLACTPVITPSLPFLRVVLLLPPIHFSHLLNIAGTSPLPYPVRPLLSLLTLLLSQHRVLSSEVRLTNLGSRRPALRQSLSLQLRRSRAGCRELCAGLLESISLACRRQTPHLAGHARRNLPSNTSPHLTPPPDLPSSHPANLLFLFLEKPKERTMLIGFRATLHRGLLLGTGEALS